MSELFNLGDVKKIEEDALAIIGPCAVPANHYFIEAVAKHLYQQWLLDTNDQKLLAYCMPLIQSLIIRYHNLLSSQDKREVFNILYMDLLESLPTYDPARIVRYDANKNPIYATLYTFCSITIRFRIYDFNKVARDKKKALEQGRQTYELLQWDDNCDSLIDDEGYYTYHDLINFMQNMREDVGQTTGKIISSFLYTITSEQALSSQGQDKIIERICYHTKLPKEIVKPCLLRLLDRYREVDRP